MNKNAFRLSVLAFLSGILAMTGIQAEDEAAPNTRCHTSPVL
jgi:hypothetical protein